MNGLLLTSKEEKMSIEIMYMAADNTITKRRIIVTSRADNYIKAYCFTRKQKWTFKLESILATVKPAKGKWRKLLSPIVLNRKKLMIQKRPAEASHP
ncbi:hypothetical protein [Domibacillus aminovorans]|uniref:WYL domain-containing protein n=1 Tax=Domibacillus aminovorans TaxID=29332 RepID=A0A177L888_9BACI|nr:hypothetical protein [Domibacillus aminovorans]OAH61938.1 hypothetical protein AWH49_10975 [Domibacillus aminovorans]